MMISALTTKAKVAAGPNRSRRHSSRVSKSSFSAAADLVVKPATPPKRISGGVGNFSVAAGVVAHGSNADTRSDIADVATKAASPPQNATSVHAVHIKQKKEVPVEVAAQGLCRQALVEVRGLSGESLVKADFQDSDRVLSVKDRVLEARNIPLWQQMLSFRGEMLNDQSTLGELKLNLLEGAVFDLVLKSRPSPEDMEALAQVLMAGTQAMGTLGKRDLMELKALKTPPQACEKVCVAALHMLAGLATDIPVKRDGSPKNADWSGCQLMLRDPARFLKQVLELPSCIDQGRVMEGRVARCRQLIDAVEGDSDSEKIQHVRRCSLACQQLITFLIGVVKYYDSVAEFRERFGGATITELKSHP